MPKDAKPPPQPLSKELAQGLEDPGTFEGIPKIREIGGESVGQ